MNLAYLVAHAINDQTWTGGILITDDRGLPLDFHYVQPITPTRIQRLIYGNSLERYLILDAIAGTLLKTANPKAEWLFTTSHLLLELQPHFHAKLVVVSDSEREPLAEHGEWEVRRQGEIALQVAPTGMPARLSFVARSREETETVAKELSELAKKLDFVEPLHRIVAALKEISDSGEEE